MKLSTLWLAAVAAAILAAPALTSPDLNPPGGTPEMVQLAGESDPKKGDDKGDPGKGGATCCAE